MTQTTFSWSLSKTTIHVCLGDLFDVDVDAIVNSEQTDFVLGFVSSTISGQIRKRYGAEVQPQLYRQTENGVLPPGTVLTTSGGQDYKRIFHAGFHNPSVWLPSDVDGNETEHVRTIRSCIRDVLERIVTDEIQSVAFPLIGCGLFGLDPALLAYEFVLEIFEFDAAASFTEKKDVWLVLRDEMLLESIVDSGVQAIIDRNRAPEPCDPFSLGVDYLDSFEQQILKSNHPQWSSWLLVRFAELVAGYIFFSLASSMKMPLEPTMVVEEGKYLAFGTLIEKAESLATVEVFSDAWVQFLAELIKIDRTQPLPPLGRINADRNNLAHGRVSRPFELIYADLKCFLQLENWRVKRDPSVKNPELGRWIYRSGEQLTGIFDKWQGKSYQYLVPHTGQVLKTPVY